MQMETQLIVMLLTQSQLIVKILSLDVLHKMLSLLVKQMIPLVLPHLGLMVQPHVLKELHLHLI